MKFIRLEAKMQNSWAHYSIVIIILLNYASAQLNDDITLRKLQLQDLENEQNHRDYEREELERLQQQQPPLPSRIHSNQDLSQLRPTNSQHIFYDNKKFHRNPNTQLSERPIAQNVRPLEQKVTGFKGNQPAGIDYASAAASNFNFGINLLTHNSLAVNAAEGDIDTDVITFSHDEPPLPLHLRPPYGPLELLSAGGAGYALASADVLVPPFQDDEVGSFLNKQPRPAVQQLTTNRFPQAPTGIIEFSNEYLSRNKFRQRQPIQYGSPQANFRQPSNYVPSNQFAYAPERSEGSALSTSAAKIPYPPSFITITTKRPETNGYIPMVVRPLGRSLGYKSQFRPSAIDPVPDLFSNRQSKSLLDSYIPSWIVANYDGFNNGFPSNRYFKRAFVETVTAQPRKDETVLKSADDESPNRKVVKKSLNKQLGINF